MSIGISLKMSHLHLFETQHTCRNNGVNARIQLGPNNVRPPAEQGPVVELGPRNVGRGRHGAVVDKCHHFQTLCRVVELPVESDFPGVRLDFADHSNGFVSGGPVDDLLAGLAERSICSKKIQFGDLVYVSW